MPLDGLTLNVLVSELDPLLKNGRVLKVYQPDNTTITLQLRLPGRTEVLLISADPVHHRIHTLQEQPENPLNPPAFCMLLRKYLEPSRLLKIEQQGLDRICRLHFEGLDPAGQSIELIMILELMGRHSNLYLTTEEGLILDALKRFPEKGVMPGKPYIPPSDQGKIEPSSLSREGFLDEIRLLPAPTTLWKWITGKFQGFSKAAAQEVLGRAGFDRSIRREGLEADDWHRVYAAFTDLLAELRAGGNPALYRTEPEDFAAYTLTGLPGEQFASANELIRTVLGERQAGKELEAMKSRLRKQISRDHKRVVRKEAIQQTELQESEHADLYRHQGELLTANFHLIPKGAKSVEVPDYTLDGAPPVTIALDERLSPSANVQRIFKRYSKAKASQDHISLQLKKTRQERRYLEDVLLQIELADNPAILREVEAELFQAGYLKRKPKPSTRKEKFQGPERYLSADGITILVGRNNRQNDLLTFRLTGPNHLWLHARNIAGSHVAVLAEGEIPPDTLWQAAHLAAYFSQSRNSPKVPVDYTLRKYVRKPKGASPGYVHYEKARTITVNPTDFTLPARQGTK